MTCSTHQIHPEVYHSLPTPCTYYSQLKPKSKGFGAGLILFVK